MKHRIIDKVKEVLEYMQHKYFLSASASVGGAFVAFFEWIQQNPQTAVYFLCFGGVALVAQILKLRHESKKRKAEREHTEKLRELELKQKQEEHELKMQKEKQEMQQDQDKHKKDLQNE